MTRFIALLFGLIVVLDFAWLLTHWEFRPHMERHAEYLGALAAILYAVDRVARRVRRRKSTQGDLNGYT